MKNLSIFAIKRLFKVFDLADDESVPTSKNATSAKFCNCKSAPGENKVGVIEMGFLLASSFIFFIAYFKK